MSDFKDVLSRSLSRSECIVPFEHYCPFCLRYKSISLFSKIRMIPRRMAKVKYFLIFLAIVFVFGLVQIATLSLVSLSPNGQKTIKKRYYLDGQNVDKGYLSHVIEAFEYAGIERSMDENNWDILWSHLYPFGKTKKFGNYLKALEETKVINKIPGSGWISR